jgi:hypothetical protein
MGKELPLDAAATEQVARAALVAARGILPAKAGTESGLVRLRAGAEAVDQEEAVLMLSRFSKPLEYEPQLIDGVLTLGCRALSAENRWRYDAVLDWLEEEGTETMEHARAGRHTRTVLLVGRRGESILLSPAELEQYERDYLLLGHYFRTEDDPDPDQAALGAVIVVKFGPASSPTFSRFGADRG